MVALFMLSSHNLDFLSLVTGDIILPISSHSLIKTIATQMRNSKNESKETREYLEEIEKRLRDSRNQPKRARVVEGESPEAKKAKKG